MTTLLIDADGPAFTAAAAAQETYWWDEDTASIILDFAKAKEIAADYIDRYVAAVDDDAEIVLCFSCPTRRYFRHDVVEGYKANRTGVPPIGLGRVKEWLAETYGSKTKPNLEADDVLGILATHPRLIKGRKVIVSMDKDLQQIPGEHLHGRFPEEGVFRVTSEFATRFLWQQVLQGDASDGYAGLPGCGPKGAQKLLAGVQLADIESTVVAAYEKAEQAEEYLASQVNAARILTAKTYDFKRKEPILWQKPPTSTTSEKPASTSSPRKRKSRSPTPSP